MKAPTRKGAARDSQVIGHWLERCETLPAVLTATGATRPKVAEAVALFRKRYPRKRLYPSKAEAKRRLRALGALLDKVESYTTLLDDAACEHLDAFRGQVTAAIANLDSNRQFAAPNRERDWLATHLIDCAAQAYGILTGHDARHRRFRSFCTRIFLHMGLDAAAAASQIRRIRSGKK